MINQRTINTIARKRRRTADSQQRTADSQQRTADSQQRTAKTQPTRRSSLCVGCVFLLLFSFTPFRLINGYKQLAGSTPIFVSMNK